MTTITFSKYWKLSIKTKSNQKGGNMSATVDTDIKIPIKWATRATALCALGCMWVCERVCVNMKLELEKNKGHRGKHERANPCLSSYYFIQTQREQKKAETTLQFTLLCTQNSSVSSNWYPYLNGSMVLKSLAICSEVNCQSSTHPKRRQHVTPTLMHLHWLLVKFCISYKIPLLTYRSLHSTLGRPPSLHIILESDFHQQGSTVHPTHQPAILNLAVPHLWQFQKAIIIIIIIITSVHTQKQLL